MNPRPMSIRTAILLWGVFIALGLSAVGLLLEKSAEAQGASYIRQNNPVDRQSHQFVTGAIVDAGADAKWENTSSPPLYEYAGRCAWNGETQCVMCYRDGGTGGGKWEDVCPNSDDPSNTSEMWTHRNVVATIGDPVIYPSPHDSGAPTDAINVVIGRNDNDVLAKHYTYNLVDVDDLTPSFFYRAGANRTIFRCTGGEPIFEAGAGFQNSSFEDACSSAAEGGCRPITGGAAWWRSEGPDPRSGDYSLQKATNIMGQNTGRTTDVRGISGIVGTYAYTIGDPQSGAADAQLYRLRPNDSNTKHLIAQSVDLTAATAIGFKFGRKLHGSFGGASRTDEMECEARIDGTQVWSWAGSTDGTFAISIAISGYSGYHTFDVACWHNVDRWNRQHDLTLGTNPTPSGDRVRIRIDCAASGCGCPGGLCSGSGAWPGCIGASCTQPPCAAPGCTGLNTQSLNTGVCLENCGGGGGNDALCNQSGPAYTFCDAIAGGCACPNLPLIMFDAFTVTYPGLAENARSCTQVAVHGDYEFTDTSGPPSDGGANLVGEGNGGHFRASFQSSGDIKSGGLIRGVIGEGEMASGSGAAVEVDGVQGLIDLQPGTAIEDGTTGNPTSSTVDLARAVSGYATVARVVTNLLMISARAPVDTGATITTLVGLHSEDLSGSIASNIYGLWSEHPGLHRIDGTLNIGLAGTTTGKILLGGGTSGIITIQPAAAAGTWTWTLPTTNGAVGEFLQTDGAGVTTWAAGGGGGLPVGTNNNVLTSDGASGAVSEATLDYLPPAAATGVLTVGVAPASWPAGDTLSVLRVTENALSGPGGISLGSNVANNSQKSAIVAGLHYTNAEEPNLILSVVTNASVNNMFFGGGVGTHNAATGIFFYGAANNTTLAGTPRMHIAGSDYLVVLGNGQPTSATASAATLSGTSSAGADLGTNDLTYQAGLPTGDGTGNSGVVGGHVFKIADGNTATAASTLHTSITALEISNTLGAGAQTPTIAVTGNFTVNGSAILPVGTNNNVLTSDGASHAVSEANLNFDGSTLAVTGSLTLTTPLVVASGGTGLATVGTNNVLTGNGAGALTAESTLDYLSPGGAATGVLTVGVAAASWPAGDTLSALRVTENALSVAGGICLGSNVANNSQKSAIVSGLHYANAEEPNLILSVVTNASVNNMFFGGGVATHNAATGIFFYGAANNTTVAGTPRMHIAGSDYLVVLGNGQPTSATASAATLSGTSSAGADLGTNDLTYQAGLPTGDGTGNSGVVGGHVFKIADGDDTTAASTLHTSITALEISNTLGAGAQTPTITATGLLAVTGAATISTTLDVTGATTLGILSTATGTLTLANSGSAFTTTLQAGVNITASRTYTLPLDFGAAGTYLRDVAGNGTLSWSAAGVLPVGINNNVLTSDGASGAVSEANLNFDGTTLAVTGAATVSTTLGVTGGVTLTSTLFSGGITRISTASATAAAVSNRLRLQHTTSAAALAGFGVSMDFKLQENDGTARIAALIAADWSDAGETTDADGRLRFKIMDSDAAATTALELGITEGAGGLHSKAMHFGLESGVMAGADFAAGALFNMDSTARGLVLTSTVADSVTKVAFIGTAHYLNAEEPAAAFFISSSVNGNTVQIGGGTSVFNAATQIKFLTDPTAGGVGLTGSVRMEINSAGVIYFGNDKSATPVASDLRGEYASGSNIGTKDWTRTAGLPTGTGVGNGGLAGGHVFKIANGDTGTAASTLHTAITALEISNTLGAGAQTPTIAVTGTTDLGDGGGTNYTSFAADGTQTMLGTARVTKHVAIEPASVKLGGTAPTSTIVGIFEVLQFTGTGATESIYFDFHIPPDMDTSEDLTVHVHWAPTDTSAGTVVWQMEWVALASNAGELLTAGTTTTTSTDPSTTVLNELLESPDMTIAAAGLTSEDTLGIRIFRDPAHGSDSYAHDASLVFVEFGYTSDKLGD